MKDPRVQADALFVSRSPNKVLIFRDLRALVLPPRRTEPRGGLRANAFLSMDSLPAVKPRWSLLGRGRPAAISPETKPLACPWSGRQFHRPRLFRI